MITKQEGNYDIGANASAEGGDEDEGFDPSVQQVNNLIDAMRLQQTAFDKKSYMVYIKEYMKKVKSKWKDRET